MRVRACMIARERGRRCRALAEYEPTVDSHITEMAPVKVPAQIHCAHKMRFTAYQLAFFSAPARRHGPASTIYGFAAIHTSVPPFLQKAARKPG